MNLGLNPILLIECGGCGLPFRLPQINLPDRLVIDNHNNDKGTCFRAFCDVCSYDQARAEEQGSEEEYNDG